jgi:hypothetical protein
MSEKPRQDPEMLYVASRSLDEDLDEPEQRLLREWLAASPTARAQLDGLAAVDRWVREWGRRGVTFEADSFAESVLDRVRSRSADSSRNVDDLLRRWAVDGPELDWDELTANVMRRVQLAARTRSVQRWVIRLAAPLAAAAVLALAVWIPFRPLVIQEPAARVVIGPAHRTETHPDAVATATIAFRRYPESSGSSATEPSLSISWVGSSPVEMGRTEVPPL